MRKFWIRRDREQYLLGGAIVTSIIASYVSAHWHFVDAVNTFKNIKTYTQEASKRPVKKMREVEYTPAKMKAGSKQYYRMDNETVPSIPRLEENEEAPATAPE